MSSTDGTHDLEEQTPRPEAAPIRSLDLAKLA